MTNTPLKTRFAPSPTGHIHLGNVRTALFNAFLARGQQGIFLLRIEDTDQTRSQETYFRDLLEDLQWLELTWQEGPDVGGEYGPYLQSERGEIYRYYFRLLEEKELVYPCFCSAAELAMVRKAQLAAGQPPRYPGTCARLNEAERQLRRKRGIEPTLRFRVPSDSMVEFTDLVRGSQRYRTDEIGDFIIRRADGSAQFFFTNAVDDALMGVNLVLRGEDHLTNTPRQLLLLQALELPAPQYGHIAMIVGADGSPLSKRHGSRSLRELRQIGFLPAAIRNYLARLGHVYERDGWLTDAELAAGFAVERLGRAPARYDETQLLYWQSEAIGHAETSGLWSWMGDSVQRRVPPDRTMEFIEAVRPNVRFPEEALFWAKRLFEDEIPPWNDPVRSLIGATDDEFFHQALATYEEFGAAYKLFVESLKKRSGLKGKALFMPLRAALTGEIQGPELARVLALLPPEIVRRRLQACCQNN